MKPPGQAGFQVRDQMEVHVKIDVYDGATNSVVLKLDVTDAARSASLNSSSSIQTRGPRMFGEATSYR